MPSWLPLLNYSTKYNVSLSTLRRRIKARSIEFKLDQGKYFILDEGSHQPILTEKPAKEPVAKKKRVEEPVYEPAPLPAAPTYASHSTQEAILTSANRLVEEIKSAYTKILQEKEEQISQLKDEIVDLRMLVRVLESSAPKPPESDPIIAQPQPPTEQAASPAGLPPEFFFEDFQNRNL